jgi:hypothetical protein
MINVVDYHPSCLWLVGCCAVPGQDMVHWPTCSLVASSTLATLAYVRLHRHGSSTADARMHTAHMASACLYSVAQH